MRSTSLLRILEPPTHCSNSRMVVIYISPMPTERTAVAIRVLKAFSIREDPDEKDVDLLRSYCPDYPALDPDELARIVIRESIQSRRNVRTMRASSGRPPL